MTLRQLVNSRHWLSVKEVLLQLYPYEGQSIDGYEEIFRKLRTMEKVDSDMEILISSHTDEFDQETYVDVSGRKTKVSDQESDISWAIEFRPWKEWLGMGLADTTVSNFTALEIIAHSLYEMTFFSFEEDEIQDSFQEIEDIAEKYEDMSPEEKKRNTKSADDILKELYDLDDEEEGSKKEDS